MKTHALVSFLIFCVGSLGWSADFFEKKMSAWNAKPETVSKWVEGAKLHYYFGMSQTNDEEKIRTLEKGQELGAKAREKEPGNAGAIFWWASCLGGVAQTKKNLWALNQLKTIEKAYLEVIEKDENYDYAAGHRAVGLLYHEAPSFISIGSSSKAKKHLERAMTLHSGYPANKLAMARFLWDEDEKARAKELANEVLKMGKALEKQPNFEWEGRDWLKKAKDIVEEKE